MVRRVVLIPAGVHELDEADAALDQAAGHQAVAGEGARFVDLRAVEVESGLRLAGDVGQLRHAGLHPVGHFVLGDAGGDLGVADVVELALVESRDVVEHLPAQLPDSRRPGC